MDSRSHLRMVLSCLIRHKGTIKLWGGKIKINSTTGTYTVFCSKLNSNCSLGARLQCIQKEGNIFAVSVEIRKMFWGMAVQHKDAQHEADIQKLLCSLLLLSIHLFFPCLLNDLLRSWDLCVGLTETQTRILYKRRLKIMF